MCIVSMLSKRYSISAKTEEKRNNERKASHFKKKIHSSFIWSRKISSEN